MVQELYECIVAMKACKIQNFEACSAGRDTEYVSHQINRYGFCRREADDENHIGLSAGLDQREAGPGAGNLTAEGASSGGEMATDGGEWTGEAIGHYDLRCLPQIQVFSRRTRAKASTRVEEVAANTADALL